MSEQPPSRKNLWRLGFTGVGLATFAIVLYLVTSTYLITYQDEYEPSQGPLGSLASMTHPQAVAFILAAYVVPALLIVGATLFVYVCTLVFVDSRRQP